MKVLKRLGVLVVIGVVICSAYVARADSEGDRPVIARAGADALVLWDATAIVAQIVSDKASDADANGRLANGALKALVQVAPRLAAAKSITVRVVYARTGAVSPVYGAATFAGVERYATLEISGADAKADTGKWKEAALDGSALPKNLTFTVTGKLPPR